ncbi:ferritin-like metal-binding protein YciE [Neobacillus cucumis]|jgi:ferritin-like metal-binding protein YciE|uniref:ferritin-like domain-containing protein n=2 Tax=Neobacillus cucumis TaxID=1740721 RepID=UPI001FDBC69C|nr:ferritin-like metal-binding protein YciE [Neobacillus cucumis]MED4226911.1 ferritin-like domain-containing protein [Neobacillus cucumis]
MQMMNQPPIPNPPRAITTKDVMYLKDAMSWELLTFKKFHSMAQQVQNPQFKDALERAGQMHQNHFQRILTHLQVDNDAALASLPNTQLQ